MTVTVWRVNLLGGVCATRGDVRIDRFRTQKTAALLAYLALHPGRSFSRDELADRFWPDDDAEKARASLRVALTNLRHALEPAPDPPGSVVTATRTHVSLRPQAVTTDVSELETAIRRRDFAAARALARGPFLPGAYDDWALAEADRIAALIESIPDESEGDAPAKSSPDSGETVARKNPRAAVSAATPSNLPVSLNRFFGRDEEGGQLMAMLLDPGVRLATILGPGGTGKTRLALEVCRGLRDGKSRVAVPGGIWFVPLADLTGSDRIPDALRASLRLPPIPGDPLPEIARAVGEKHAIFVLDNLEQLDAGLGGVLRKLLETVPSCTILATSRRRAGVDGERFLSLKPLPTPETDLLETLARNASVALFVDRARAAQPDFGLTERNAATISRLCARLDGVPLAIELAASWTGVLSPRQIDERLAEPLSLSSRQPDRPDRHRSLRAVIEWSFELLSPAHRKLLTALSAFDGGFTADSVRALTDDPEALWRLESLAQHSLMAAEPDSEPLRFRLLESVRAFADETFARLPGDEQAGLRRNHAEHFLTLADRFSPDESGSDTGERLDRLESERQNLERAIRTFLADVSVDGARGALTLAGRLYRFWEVRGPMSTGRALYAEALAHPRAADDDARAERSLALNGAGMLALRQRDFAVALRFHEECLALRREIGDPLGIGKSLHNLASAQSALKNRVAVEAALRESIEIHRSAGNKVSEATSLITLGNEYIRAEEPDLAFEYLEAARRILEPLDNQGRLVYVYNGLGTVAYFRGDTEGERASYRRALALCQSLGDAFNAASAAINLADSLAEVGDDPARAVRYFALWRRLLEENGIPLTRPSDRVDAQLDALREIIGLEALAENIEIAKTAPWRTTDW